MWYEIEDLKDNTEVMMSSVSKGCCVLEYDTEVLKKDPEVELGAGSQYGSAFLSAFEELKQDREVVLARVAERSVGTECASQ